MNTKKSLNIIQVIFLLLVGLTTQTWAQGDLHILGKQKTTIVPEQFLREYDPITVFFNKNKGPDQGGVEIDPDRFLKIQPEHPGEFRWLDGRTLQFLPTIAWPALEKYKITVQGKLYRLATLMKPPAAVWPEHGSTHLDPIQNISLAFVDQIETERLKHMISFEVRDLPGLKGQETLFLTHRDFKIKAIERSSLRDHVKYQLTFHRPITYGKRLDLSLRLSADDRINASVARYSFSTKPLFRVVGMGCSSIQYPIASIGSVYTKDQTAHCGTNKGELFLIFSDNLSAISLEQVKRLINFKPAVKNLSYHVNGKRIHLSFDAERERPYQMSVNHIPMKSSSARDLAWFGETGFYFYYSRANPYLKWGEKQGIVERYGPQKFPMYGRDTAQLDLRIYKIDPLDRNFWPFRNAPLVLKESQRPAGPGEEPNFESNMAEHIRQLGSPLVSKIVKLPMEKRTDDIKFGLDLSGSFEKISGPKQPGSYLVGYRSVGTSTERSYVRIQVTDLSLSTIEEESGVMFVVTSLKTGLPIKNAEITVEGEDLNNRRAAWQTVISGKTDNNGMFHYTHSVSVKNKLRRIYVKKDKDMLVLNPDYPPSRFINNHWYSSGSGWLRWLNQRANTSKRNTVRKVHMFTERPIYKPEEEVHIKGYLRWRQMGRLSIKHESGLSIQVNGPGGKTWTYPVTLSDMGSFYHKFKEEDLPTGHYTAYLLGKHKEELGSVSFGMEAYRIPKFEINITGPDKVPLDRPFTLNMTADYYAGGQVIDQEVSWRATQFAYWFQPPGRKGFIFSTNKRFYGGSEDFESSGSLQKTGKTDENGTSDFTIDPSAELNAQPRQYVVEVTVRGADEQTVTNTKKVVALPPYMVGLKLDRLLKNSMNIQPEILVLDHNSKPVAGVELKLRLLQRQWHSHLKETDITTGEAKYMSEVVDNPILERSLISKKGVLSQKLPVEESGIYIVEVLARDKLGRLQKVSKDLYVAGDTPVTWQKTKANVFQNTLDKTAYIPGEKAELLIKSPFQNAQALVIVEAPDRNEYHWVDIKNGKGIIKLAISEDMVPQLPIHTMLMRGRIKKVNKSAIVKHDRSKPIMMAATTWIKVNPKNNQLTIRLDHPESLLPGSEMEMTVNLSDPDGKPLNGEVTLWLVDKAVLALGKEKRLNPLPSFIDPTKSYIRIRDTRNDIIGDIYIEEQTGGDGSLAEARIFDSVTVRKNFKTVPYYNPRLIVKNGKAKISIPMPDNLTDFAVRAVAIDGKARFGSVKSQVSIRLPLIVQSALPRFVRPGDRFMAGGIGRVVEGKGGPGRAELIVKGLSVEGGLKRKVNWKSGISQQLYFPLTVESTFDPENADNNNVTIAMAVERDHDRAKDAFRVSLPVRKDRSAIFERQFAQINHMSPLKLLEPEEKPRPGTVNNSVVVTSEPALIKMLSGLDYLSRFPHGCTEQRISQLLPQLVLHDVLSKIGEKGHEKRIKHSMAETLLYLESVKQQDGLYSYWPGSSGYVNLTAYVVEFLLAARQYDHAFKPDLLDDGIRALKQALRSDYSHFISGASFYERAAALYALALAGELDESYTMDLYTMAFNRDIFSEANILYIMKKYMDRESKAKRLSEDLWSTLIFRMRNGMEEYHGLQYRSSNWGGLINSGEIRTLAGVSRALYAAEPGNPRVKFLVNELVSRGEGDGWGSTSANAAALLALGELLENPKVSSKRHKLKLIMGKKSTIIDTKDTILQRKTHHSADKGTLEYLSGPQDSLPHVMQSLSYLPSGHGDLVKQKNTGFVVDRELLLFKDDKQPPIKTPIESGQTITLDMGVIVEEHIQVINPEKRHFVAISVPFAAGFDPMNPNLATSPKEAEPRGQITRKPDYALYNDDQVTFYYDTLPKGTYHFYYRLRSTTEGSFSHPAAKAEMMYRQTVWGRSNGTRIVIRARK